MLLAALEVAADEPALDDGEHVCTYADLVGRVESAAALFAAAGLGRGHRVGIRISSGTNELYIAILATLWIGAA